MNTQTINIQISRDQLRILSFALLTVEPAQVAEDMTLPTMDADAIQEELEALISMIGDEKSMDEMPEGDTYGMCW